MIKIIISFLKLVISAEGRIHWVFYHVAESFFANETMMTFALTFDL